MKTVQDCVSWAKSPSWNIKGLMNTWFCLRVPKQRMWRAFFCKYPFLWSKHPPPAVQKVILKQNSGSKLSLKALTGSTVKCRLSHCYWSKTLPTPCRYIIAFLFSAEMKLPLNAPHPHSPPTQVLHLFCLITGLFRMLRACSDCTGLTISSHFAGFGMCSRAMQALSYCFVLLVTSHDPAVPSVSRGVIHQKKWRHLG